MAFFQAATLFGAFVLQLTLTTATPVNITELAAKLANLAYFNASISNAVLVANNATSLDSLLPPSAFADGQPLVLVADSPPAAVQKRQDGDDPRCSQLRSGSPVIPYTNPLKVVRAWCLTPKTVAFVCSTFDQHGLAHTYLAREECVGENIFCKEKGPTSLIQYNGEAWCSEKTIVKRFDREEGPKLISFKYGDASGSREELLPVIAFYDSDWLAANADSVSFSSTTKQQSYGDFTGIHRAVGEPIKFDPKAGITGMQIKFTAGSGSIVPRDGASDQQTGMVAVVYLNVAN